MYLTPVGGWLHMRGLRPNQPPHSVPAPPAQLSTATVVTVRLSSPRTRTPLGAYPSITPLPRTRSLNRISQRASLGLFQLPTL